MLPFAMSAIESMTPVTTPQIRWICDLRNWYMFQAVMIAWTIAPTGLNIDAILITAAWTTRVMMKSCTWPMTMSYRPST